MFSYIRKDTVFKDIACKEKVILSTLWIIGFVCGLYFVLSADCASSDFFLSATRTPVSVLGIFTVAFLPIIISAISIFCALPFLIYTLCFCKAFSYGFVCLNIALTFGYSGWLIRLLLLFSSTCTSMSLFWLWHSGLSRNRITVQHDFIICIVIAAAIGIVDYFMVSPYLAVLMNYT